MITLILFAAAIVVYAQLTSTLTTISLYEVADRLDDLPSSAKVVFNMKCKLHPTK